MLSSLAESLGDDALAAVAATLRKPMGMRKVAARVMVARVRFIGISLIERIIARRRSGWSVTRQRPDTPSRGI
jgi:hypothetical protein